MRDNTGTIISLVLGSIFFVALANEFVIFYSDIKYEEVTWSYFLIRGCSYYPAEENFEDYCEPFIGQLPTTIKFS